MKNHYQHFTNKKCEYYPCHKNVKNLNCLMCYCPLYNFADCDGDFTYVNGIKYCSDCVKPHDDFGFIYVVSHLEWHNQQIRDDHDTRTK